MSQMDLGPEYRPRSSPQREIDDFRRALPKGVLPTSARLLGCNGHLLVTRHFEHGHTPSGAQTRLFKDGSVSVACFWGVPGLPVERTMQIFDHMGVGERTPADDDKIQSAIRHWWLDRGGR
jgi:hypothetical protein